MAFSAKKAVIAALVLVALAICSCSAVEVLPLRIDNPAPDGSGVVFFQLQAATAGASFANFKILSTSISGSQSLKLWNAAAGTCDGTTLSADGLVPTDGKVCFWGTAGAEGESSFNYAAVDGDGTVGTSQKVVIVNYNVQSCSGIPDLGASGFATVPASPEVSITLNGLEIQFEVTASYLRNQSAWFIDFFDFDQNADSADGTGRTCSNHVSSAFTGSFPQWWQSQPRATFTSTLVGSTVSPALDDPTFPMYKSNARWGIEAAGCDKVKYTATIPTVNLISNGVSDCTRNGQPNTAATANGLNYTATLYVSALRPRDINDKTKGYYQVTYTYPFSFRIQQTVTDIRTTSSAFAFQVSVDNMRVTRGQGLTLSVETIISDPNSANTPDLDGFQLASYPHQTGHTAAPTLERVSTNSHCPNTQHLPCAIMWRVTINELTLAQLDNDMDAYNRQFVGAYTLQWTALSSPTNLPLKAQLIIDAVAANSTDLGQLAVESKVNFFRSQDDMLRTDDTVGLTSPTFSSGEKIWVRHSFLVDSADVSAYVFTLQRAWVCWSPVAGFVPTINPGTGCAQDVPGVMEAALGHRFLLYNISVGGIADTVPAGSTQKSRVWGWTLVQPTSSSWSGGQTVHSGFGINALPLVSDAQPHTYYFHLVSQVSQATLPNPVAKRAAARAQTQEGLFLFKREDGVDTSSGVGMSAITVVSEQSASPASQLSAGWAAELMAF